MKHLPFVLVLTAILIACSPPTATETTCPDGTKCIAVDCTSGSYSHTDCLVVFGQKCSGGYDIVYDQGGNYLIRCHEKKW